MLFPWTEFLWLSENLASFSCSGGSATLASGIHIPRVWHVVMEAPPLLCLSPNPATFQKALQTRTPPPEILKTTPTGSAPSENRLSLSSHLLSWGAGKPSGSILPIKPGLFLVWFDLVWFDCCQWRCLWGAGTSQRSHISLQLFFF